MCLHVEQLYIPPPPQHIPTSQQHPHTTPTPALDDQLPCPRDTNEANDSISDSRAASSSVNSSMLLWR